MPYWNISLFCSLGKEDTTSVRNILTNHGIGVYHISESNVSVRDDKLGAENRVFAAAEEIRAFFGLDEVILGSESGSHSIKTVCLI